MRNVLAIVAVVAACKSHSSELAPSPATPHDAARQSQPDATAKVPVTALPIPGGEHGIGFDDLRFATGIGKVVAPAGGT
ncbi:MAG TPA: hypothetical protein VIV40_15340, partial [Kofleriaceae bacterium]